MVFLRRTHVIDNVRNRVSAYEDSVLRYNEMVRMAAYKDSLAKQPSNEVRKKMKSERNDKIRKMDVTLEQ